MTSCKEQQGKYLALVRNAQKNQTMNKMRSVNRVTLERANKASAMNTRNYKQKRADMLQATKNSRANNNRKC